MLFSLRSGVLLLAFISIGATAFRIDQPVATPIDKHYNTDGWTPLPTSGPEIAVELLKRQANPALCGYREGDGDLPVTCGKASSCLRYPSSSWFGCCTGTSISDCNIHTRCVESRSVSACSSRSDCINDKLALTCISSASPFCGLLYKTVSGGFYGHFVCASKATSVEVLSTSKGSGSSSSKRASSTSRNSTSSSTRRSSNSTSTRVSSRSSGVNSDSVVIQSTDTISTIVSTQSTSSGNEQLTSQSAGGASSQISSSAQAMRTAEAVVGVVGGIAGILALMV